MLAVVAVGLLALTGCSSSVGPTEGNTPPPPTPSQSSSNVEDMSSGSSESSDTETEADSFESVNPETSSDSTIEDLETSNLADPSTIAISSVTEACETFNSLFADYAALKAQDGTDPNPYEDIYLLADEAETQTQEVDPDGQVYGLFTALGILALDHATAAELGESPSQESRDLVMDAVLGNSTACTGAGVALRL